MKNKISYMNSAMEDYLEKCKKNQNLESMSHSLNQKISSILNSTKQVGECVIYDDESIDESDIDWKRIVKFTNSFSGYEVGCNEFFIPLEDFRGISLLSIAYNILTQLRSKFLDKTFVVYTIVHNEYVEIRFHVFRKEDGLWLSDNLDEYKMPIFYLMQ